MFSFVWNNLLFYPILNFLLVVYHLLGDNLGLAVILLAIITRLILIPSTKKQLEMTKKMTSLKPKLDELNKKYANNKEELAKQQMKLYKETGYNPLGCFASFVPQLVILMVIVQVIRVVTTNTFDGIYPFVKDFVFGTAQTLQLDKTFLFWDLSRNFSQIAKESGYFAIQGIAYFVLAILVGIVQWWSTRVMQNMQSTNITPKKKTNPNEQMAPEEMQQQMMKSMNTIFPAMTALMTLSTPAVLGVYWLIQSIMFVFQYYFIDKEKFRESLKKSLTFSFPKKNKLIKN